MALVSEEQKQQYAEDGYFFLENVIPDHFLEMLRGKCQLAIDLADAEMDELGTDSHRLNHRNKRYFRSRMHETVLELNDFLFSDLIADICRATLGENAYLFNEQYVIKGADIGMKFSWHQDSGYVGYPDHKPYLSCWCALDDMSEANGTVRVMPFTRVGIRSFVKHIQEEGSNDLVGYFGDNPGVAAIVPAGSIVVFSSVNFHSSGSNSTANMRRSYLAQYSAEPLLKPDGSGLWRSAEPLLLNGENAVGEPEPQVGAVATG